MSEGWARLPGILMRCTMKYIKEDEMLYQEFVQRMNLNKMKMAKKVNCHKYSCSRPLNGWNFTVEMLGSRGKHGNGGGWKFVSQPDGSSGPFDEFEKMFVKRERPQKSKEKFLSFKGCCSLVLVYTIL